MRSISSVGRWADQGQSDLAGLGEQDGQVGVAARLGLEVPTGELITPPLAVLEINVGWIAPGCEFRGDGQRQLDRPPAGRTPLTVRDRAESVDQHSALGMGGRTPGDGQQVEVTRRPQPAPNG